MTWRVTEMLDRRRFLFATGSLAAAGIGGFYLQNKSASGLREVRRGSHALGTQMNILALHADEMAARQAINAAFAEIEVIESVMSIYRPDSQLSRLNLNGELASPHAYLIAVLEHAQQLARETGGAFDVTVQPLWQAFSSAKKRGALPSAAEVANAKGRVDFQKIQIAPATIRLERGMQITLNGIAQGFAVDRAMAVLRAHGIEHALLDTGEQGSIGHKANGERWKVGVQHPRAHDALSAVLHLDGRCLSTSGDYATRFSEDFSSNHIFDPHTGDSPRELSSVSVLAGSGMEADALSTAVFVLGIERGAKLLESRGADGFFIAKDGRSTATADFQKLLCNS